MVIGHRLATLGHADQVAVLDGGRLIAQGSWGETEARLAALGLEGLVAAGMAPIRAEGRPSAPRPHEPASRPTT